MSDWDASEDEAAPAAAPVPAARVTRRFDDEDVEDEGVKDSWSASEDDEPKPAAPTGPAPPVRQKGITKQKIAEKEAAERARAEAIAREAALNADPAERRKREQAAQLRSDMDNVAGLFGAAAVNGSGSGDLFSATPKTREDFEAYANKVAEHLYDRHGSKAFYADFVDHLAKALCTPLKDLEVRKASSTLSTLANEKQRATREAAGGKKKKGGAKPGLGLAKAGGYDTRIYDESLDDFGVSSGAARTANALDDDDDFM